MYFLKYEWMFEHSYKLGAPDHMWIWGHIHNIFWEKAMKMSYFSIFFTPSLRQTWFVHSMFKYVPAPLLRVAEARNRPCNRSYSETGIWGWLEDGSPACIVERLRDSRIWKVTFYPTQDRNLNFPLASCCSCLVAVHAWLRERESSNSWFEWGKPFSYSDFSRSLNSPLVAAAPISGSNLSHLGVQDG